MDLSLSETIILLVVFWIVGQIVLGFMSVFHESKKRDINSLTEKLSSMIHMVKVEKHGEIDYWFDDDSGQFLGQGVNFEEIVDHIKSRFPEHIFLIKGKGGIAAQTDWKLVSVDEFRKITFSSEIR